MKNEPQHLQEEIATRLRALQKIARATDQQMANYVGIGRTAWSNATSLQSKSRNKPPEEAMVRLCEKSGLTMEWVYRGDYSKVPHALAIALIDALDPDRGDRPYAEVELAGF